MTKPQNRLKYITSKIVAVESFIDKSKHTNFTEDKLS